MKKEILALTFGFFAATTAFAQEELNIKPNKEPNGFVTLNAGIGMPTDYFANKNFNDYTATYAKNGAMVDLTIGYKILKNLGITAMFRHQTNAIDINEYAKDMEDFYNSGSSSSNTSVIIEAQPYQLNSAMVGIYGTFKITNRLSFEPRALAGYATAVLPNLKENIYNSGAPFITYSRESAQTNTISSIIGVGVNYKLAKRVNLMFNVDYHTAYAEWKQVKKSYHNHISDMRDNRYYNYSRIFSIINTNMGLGYRF